MTTVNGTQIKHGTMFAYWSGCRCENCKWVNKFSHLINNNEDMEVKPNSEYVEPKPHGKRQFPARNLVMFLQEPNATLLAEKLGCKRGTVSKWLRNGVCFTVWEADRWAIKAGTHPAVVWGLKFYDEVC